jgi:hypothetical protein
VKGIQTSAKLLGATNVRCAVVSGLVSLAFVSQAFAVLRPPFPAKPAAPFDAELIIVGEDLVPQAKTEAIKRCVLKQNSADPFAVAAACDRRVFWRRLSY